MIIDARQVPSGAAVDCDVCIVGGGAAGITIARELRNGTLRTCLLEGGGLEPDPDTQSLCAGDNIGLPYFELHETRFRYFGGSTNRWAGWCRPLDPLDFAARPWVAGSGWPLTRDTLEPYYRRAQSVCEIDAFAYEPSDWGSAVPDLYRLPLQDAGLRTTLWQGSPPTKFGRVYRRELQQATSVTIYLHANAVRLDADEPRRTVQHARVACLGGNHFSVAARVFILTAGAIESARLLLVSGLGNDHDNVGRYFMEHPHLLSGRIVLDHRRTAHRPTIAALDKAVTGALARLRLRRPMHDIKCGLALSEAAQQQHEILNYSAHLFPAARLIASDAPGYHSLRLIVANLRSVRRLAAQIRHRRLPDGLRQHLSAVARNPITALRAASEELIRRPVALQIYNQSEQAPNRDSRVTLATSRDRLDVPRVRLDWRLSPMDKRTIRIAQQLLGRHLEQRGIGHLESEPWLETEDNSWPPDLGGGHHHMGTARMSTDPKTGVVDPTGRVHGVANLYVADGSVFPTGGYSNPLLTIVALALRAADSVRSALR